MEELEFHTTVNPNDSDIHICDDYPDFNTSDFWSLATYENLRENLEWSIALVTASVLIFLVGVIGNSIVILVMSLRPPMRTVTNMFLINLAVADLLVIVFCVPATLLSNLFIPWILGSFMCKAAAYVQGVSVCASAYSLVALSLDRCNLIYRSMERRPGISKNQALVIIIFIWIFSSLITLPWPFAFEVVESDCQIYCIEVWKNEHAGQVYFLLAHLTCCYCIPLLVICSSNIAIWCYVSKRQASPDCASISKIQKKTRHSVKRTIRIVTLAFLICWLPLYVLATRIQFSSINRIKEWEENLLSFLLPFAQWLGSLNSTMNPIIYAFTNKKFRKGLRSLMSCFLGKNNRREDHHNHVSGMRGSNQQKSVNLLELKNISLGRNESTL